MWYRHPRPAPGRGIHYRQAVSPHFSRRRSHLGFGRHGQAAAGATYVALGDSISIDDYAGGAGRGAASLLLRNRSEDFPDWDGRDLRSRIPHARLVQLAADGATSADVVDLQLPRLSRLGVVPSMATVTMGGNDLLLVYGDTSAARAARRRLVDNTRKACSFLRCLMGAVSPIVIGTIYDPSDGTGSAERLGLPPWPDALALLDEFNQALVELAAEHRALVADLHQRFLGHGVLAGNPAQSRARPRNRDLWYCNLIEPNAWGASEVRRAFWQALESEWDALRG
jgi:lysophospholipase L1-like esterase